MSSNLCTHGQWVSVRHDKRDGTDLISKGVMRKRKIRALSGQGQGSETDDLLHFAECVQEPRLA